MSSGEVKRILSDALAQAEAGHERGESHVLVKTEDLAVLFAMAQMHALVGGRLHGPLIAGDEYVTVPDWVLMELETATSVLDEDDDEEDHMQIDGDYGRGVS